VEFCTIQHCIQPGKLEGLGEKLGSLSLMESLEASEKKQASTATKKEASTATKKAMTINKRRKKTIRCNENNCEKLERQRDRTKL